MDIRALQNVPLLAAVAFTAGILVLAMQLITPAPVMISLGESGTQTTSVGQYFTYPDITVAVVASGLCGASGTYLVLHDRTHRLVNAATRRDSLQEPTADTVGNGENGTEPTTDTTAASRERWEETAARLTNNQETIYTALVEAEGTLPQRDLVEQTDLSKATVSRTLDKLEHRGLVERRRNGMGNTVHIQ